MSIPDLRISDEAVEHVREAVATWPGDARDLALAMAAFGRALLLITDGRDDHIDLIEAGAKALAEMNERPTLNG